jgi:hypothetical protein
VKADCAAHRRHCERSEAIQLPACGAMDCFARNEGENTAHSLRGSSASWNRCNKIYTPQQFFIMFVDAIFTILFERLFTNIFDVTSATAAIACLYRGCNAD